MNSIDLPLVAAPEQRVPAHGRTQAERRSGSAQPTAPASQGRPGALWFWALDGEGLSLPPLDDKTGAR